MLDLYKNIREKRQMLGMSQQELADKLGYTDRSSITKIESGSVDLPLSKIKLFAEALKTSAPDLMGFDSDGNHVFMECMTFHDSCHDKYEQLDAADKEFISRTIDGLLAADKYRAKKDMNA